MENIRSKIDESYKHKASTFETVFGKVAKGFMIAANPFKKFAFKTPCLMHRFINIQAVHLLENEGYENAADFYREMIKPLNEGATWIDQDFKSTNHFYHFERHKGLFGFSDALSEVLDFKSKIDRHLKNGNLTRALFYTGVICHLTQDMTVPQHVNNKLLESHRDYEVWILSKSWDEIDFSVKRGIIRYDKFESYIRMNTLITNEIYKESRIFEDREDRYRFMAKRLISFTQRVTAGLLLDFYEAYYNEFDPHIEGGLKVWKTSKEFRHLTFSKFMEAMLEDSEILNSQISITEEALVNVDHKETRPASELGKALEELKRMVMPDPEEEMIVKEAEEISKKQKKKVRNPMYI